MHTWQSPIPTAKISLRVKYIRGYSCEQEFYTPTLLKEAGSDPAVVAMHQHRSVTEWCARQEEVQQQKPHDAELTADPGKKILYSARD